MREVKAVTHKNTNKNKKRLRL